MASGLAGAFLAHSLTGLLLPFADHGCPSAGHHGGGVVRRGGRPFVPDGAVRLRRRPPSQSASPGRFDGDRPRPVDSLLTVVEAPRDCLGTLASESIHGSLQSPFPRNVGGLPR